MLKQENYNYQCINDGCKEQAMQIEGGGYHYECQNCEDKHDKAMKKRQKEKIYAQEIVGKMICGLLTIKHIEGYLHIFQCRCGNKFKYNRAALYDNKPRHCGCVKDINGKPTKGRIINPKFVD